MACLVSFRSLFVHHEQPSAAARRAAEAQRPRSRYYPNRNSGRTPQQSGDGSRGSRFKQFQDSLLDTCRTLEGVFDDDDTLVGHELSETQRRSQPGVDAGHESNVAQQQERGLDHDQISVSDRRDIERDGGSMTGQTTSAAPWRPSTSTSHQLLEPSYIGSGGRDRSRSEEQPHENYPQEPSPMSSADHISISQLSQDSLMLQDEEDARDTEPSPMTPTPVYQSTRWRPE